MQGVVSRFGLREKWAVFSPLFTPLPIVILGGGVFVFGGGGLWPIFPVLYLFLNRSYMFLPVGV